MCVCDRRWCRTPSTHNLIAEYRKERDWELTECMQSTARWRYTETLSREFNIRVWWLYRNGPERMGLGNLSATVSFHSLTLCLVVLTRINRSAFDIQFVIQFRKANESVANSNWFRCATISLCVLWKFMWTSFGRVFIVKTKNTKWKFWEKKKIMEKSMTATAKSTPFSINDILTKNNTTIFRRCISSGNLSPISQKSFNEHELDAYDPMAADTLTQSITRSMRLFKYDNVYIDRSRKHGSSGGTSFANAKRRISSESTGADDESGPDDETITYEPKVIKQYDAIENNNDDHYENGHRKSCAAERRRSLDCFLVDKNHNLNENAGLDRRHGQNRPIKMGFYNYPLVVETPLDMRRCNNNHDSGKRVVRANSALLMFIVIYAVWNGFPWKRTKSAF